MKILWFSTSPSLASEAFGYSHKGCGWIASLEPVIAQSQEFTLGICFFYEGDSFKKITQNKTTYFGIPLPKSNAVKRIVQRQAGILNDEFDSPHFATVLHEFEPDLIHVFGTENGYGKILINKFEKVVFHLQGLTAPITDVFFPPRISKYQSLLNDSIGNILRGLTSYHAYKAFINRAAREKQIIRHFNYFSGRTSFDKNYVNLLNSNADYFHCDELLRPIFFQTKWEGAEHARAPFKIATTINPNIYKGLDVIYRVMSFLDHLNIEWNIFGLEENHPLNHMIKKSLAMSVNKKMIFHGPVSAELLASHLSKCHLFVHPSYTDNSPNSVCEAMLLGMPVAASSVGGIQSLITHNQTGFLFNPHDTFELAGLIHMLLDNYAIATEAGQAARQVALERHNPDIIFKSIKEMYQTIINSR